MDNRIERTPQVRRDLVDLADYIAKDSFDAALRFLNAAEATFEFLARNRGVGQICEFVGTRLADIRVWPVDGFRNHLVFFRPTDSGIHVVRVLHGSRDIDSLFMDE